MGWCKTLKLSLQKLDFWNDTNSLWDLLSSLFMGTTWPLKKIRCTSLQENHVGMRHFNQFSARANSWPVDLHNTACVVYETAKSRMKPVHILSAVLAFAIALLVELITLHKSPSLATCVDKKFKISNLSTVVSTSLSRMLRNHVESSRMTWAYLKSFPTWKRLRVYLSGSPNTKSCLNF